MKKPPKNTYEFSVDGKRFYARVFNMGNKPESSRNLSEHYVNMLRDDIDIFRAEARLLKSQITDLQNSITFREELLEKQQKQLRNWKVACFCFALMMCAFAIVTADLLMP
jgi:chaperonin GroEL (HSP60 family)